MYSVYHAKEPNFGLGAMPHWPMGYQKVAEVEANSLEEVFELTNHIDSNWLQNQGVHSALTQARSTSVGDVVEDPNGRLWLCESVGWREISKNRPDQLHEDFELEARRMESRYGQF